MTDRLLAARLLRLIDLTSLGEDATPARQESGAVCGGGAAGACY